ncbi:hypothetical protein G6L37_35190 [Agrobacterium rubi]|nr:hypothetical protein [Agrobacterium rubi]NTF23816.1 hypothetical protein [Agrobacterium rubi]
MTRLQEFLKERPIIAAFVTAAVIAGSAACAMNGPDEKTIRMSRGELVTVDQAASMHDRAHDTLSEMQKYVSRLGAGSSPADVAEFRTRMHSATLDLLSVRYLQEAGKKARQPDPLAVSADEIQLQGRTMARAVSMLRVWEQEARSGNFEAAADAREIIRGILDGTRPDAVSSLSQPDGTPQSTFYRS